MSGLSSGLLAGGVPYVVMGHGPPVVLVAGLTPSSDVPMGWTRRAALSGMAELSSDFRVYWVNRKQGLREGESLSDIAGHLAAAIEADIGEPVRLAGRSSGGSLALQFAVDRPDLVRALVVVAQTYRTAGRSRQVGEELARSIRAGDAVGGWARALTADLPTPLQGPMMPLARVMARSMVPDDPTGLLVRLEAELAFDVGDQLGRISAPTLVIGGAKDHLNPADELVHIANRVQDGRAHIYPTWGHQRTCTSATTAGLMLGFFLATTGGR